MDDLLLSICTCLSCFIVATILFQFMNDRYNKTFHNKYLAIRSDNFSLPVIN